MFARLLPIALALVLVTGCEKATHDNIDKWGHTQKGPDKLKKALADEGLDADLSAHAAQVLIVKKGMDNDVRQILTDMSPPRRAAVVGKLAPRLWEAARVEGETQLPNAQQVVAKDQLVMMRKFADDATKKQIDGYLMDWYCVPSYDDGRGGGRAAAGAVLGAAVVRMIGPEAGKKLLVVAHGVVDAPGQDKAKNRVGDELMLGLAASQNPDAVKYVLDIAQMDRHDETLATRAMSALFKAYVDPGGLFDLCEPAPLIPNLDEIEKIAKNDAMPGSAANDAVSLIRVVGMPKCLDPLVDMIAHPHANTRFKYVGANNALKCGGVKAIQPVVRALPEGPYAKDELVGAVAGEIAKLTPRDQVLAALRELLDDKKTVVRWTAIEALAAMKSVEDAPKIAAVKSSDRLVGFWGDQSGKDAKDRKEDPTLGGRAKELADQLGKRPK